MTTLPTETVRFSTPLGTLEVEAHERGVTRVAFTDKEPTQGLPSLPGLRQAVEQLKEYAEGRREDFHSLTLCMMGTKFQADVWSALLEVPYGQTVTYGELAEKAGHPGAARAVGGAVNANPLCVIVPCHRVTASGGDIGGYAYGVATKEKLLRLERGLITR